MKILKNFFKEFTNKKNISELLQGSALSFGFKVFGTLAGFLATIVTTRFYSAEALGIVSLSYTILQLTSIISKLGLDTASLRLISEYRQKGQLPVIKNVYVKSFLTVLTVSCVFTIVLFFSSGWIATKIFEKEHLSVYIRWISFLVPFYSLMLLNVESLRGLKRIGYFSFFRTAAIHVFNLILLLVGYQFYDNDYIPLIILLCVVGIVFIYSSIIWYKSVDLTVKPNNIFSIKKLLSISYPMLLSSSVMYIMN